MSDLIERLRPPSDWREPEWSIPDRIHNWRNYATQELQMIWHTLDDRQAIVIASMLGNIAGDEEWE